MIVGNFIADGIKGNQLASYPAGIAEGIRLHRKIDSFTDQHPVVGQSKSRLYEDYSKYSAVIVDLYYDHFLASLWSDYHPQSLEKYAIEQYSILRKSQEHFPEKTKLFFHYMQIHNWLVAYRSVDGISQVLRGMSRRAKFESHMETAGVELIKNYELYKAEFVEFFEELKAYVDGLIQRT